MSQEEIKERERRPHFAALVGIEWLDDDPEDVRGRVEVREDLLQPWGVLDGGVISTLVEDACSRATALAVVDDGMVAMGQSISVNFTRPISGSGSAEVRARARHRGRTTWVWEAEVLDDAGNHCAAALMTIAVRPPPSRG